MTTKQQFIDKIKEAIEAYNDRLQSLPEGQPIDHPLIQVGTKLQEALWWTLLTPGATGTGIVVPKLDIKGPGE